MVISSENGIAVGVISICSGGENIEPLTDFHHVIDIPLSH
jgi:hypothetical protein